MKFKKFVRKHYLKIIPLLALIVLGIIFVLINNIGDKLYKFETENANFYLYIAGEKMNYEGKLKIDNTKKITELSFNDVKYDFDTTPIYYESETKVIFPKEMAVVYPKDSQTYRTDYYAVIEHKQDNVSLTDHTINKELIDCFLYDTKDLYFFISETTITFGKEKIVLSPLSYVVVNYNNRIDIYDYQTGIYNSYEAINVEAYATTGNYKVNLSMDSFVYNNQDQLLIKRLDILNKLSV